MIPEAGTGAGKWSTEVREKDTLSARTLGKGIREVFLQTGGMVV